jgi:hypothetical protein
MFHEKLRVKKFSALDKSQTFTAVLTRAATGTCSEPDDSNKHPHVVFI